MGTCADECEVQLSSCNANAGAEYYHVQDEYMYLGDECQHLQVLPYTLRKLMPAPRR